MTRIGLVGYVDGWLYDAVCKSFHFSRGPVGRKRHGVARPGMARLGAASEDSNY